VELREFIAQTLLQIVNGVSDAQGADTGGEINPRIWSARKDDAAKLKILESNGGNWIHLVDFDVAITVVEGTSTQGGLGLVVGPVALGTKGQSKDENSSISRIKFQVPVSFPSKKAAA